MTVAIPDLINGIFEFCGSIAIFGHCRQILKDRIVKGVNWKSVVFFSSWGAYNTFYYSNLAQWCSFTGGLFIFAANLIWMYLLWKYWDRPPLMSIAVHSPYYEKCILGRGTKDFEP